LSISDVVFSRNDNVTDVASVIDVSCSRKDNVTYVTSVIDAVFSRNDNVTDVASVIDVICSRKNNVADVASVIDIGWYVSHIVRKQLILHLRQRVFILVHARIESQVDVTSNIDRIRTYEHDRTCNFRDEAARTSEGATRSYNISTSELSSLKSPDSRGSVLNVCPQPLLAGRLNGYRDRPRTISQD
jgi:hypothetical protein